MQRYLKLAAIAVAATALMGFDTAHPWDSIEGEWAVDSAANCGGANSLTFTYDYKRDENGDVERPFIGASNEPRRTRLATVMEGGNMGYRVTIRDEGTMTGDMQLTLGVKRPSLWPFSGFRPLTLEALDDDTLQEVSAEGDGNRLMRALGAAPVRLVRCPASED